MGNYGEYLCKSPCNLWNQVIAHTERDGYVNPHTQYGNRWSIEKVRVSDCYPEQGRYCIKIRLTIKTVKTEDLGLWYVGFDQVSTDTMVPFWVAEVRAGEDTMASQSPISLHNKTDIPCVVIQGQGPVRIVQTKDLKEVIEV